MSLVPNTEYITPRQPEVYLRSTHADAWAAAPDLECQRLRLVTKDRGLDHATFLFRKGFIHKPDRRTNTYELLEALPGASIRAFVRVDIPIEDVEQNYRSGPTSVDSRTISLPNRALNVAENKVEGYRPGNVYSWFGVITNESIINEAAKTPSDVPLKQFTSDSVFTAYGMEWFLTRIQYTSSFVGLIDAVDEIWQVPRGFPVNVRTRSDRTGANHFKGNKGPLITTFPNGADSHVFDIDAIFGFTVAWTTSEFIAYLLRWFFPRFDRPLITDEVYWHLVNPDVLDWHEPNTSELHGHTIFQILQSLASPQRGTFWRIEAAVDELLNDVQYVLALYSTWGETSDLNLPEPGKSLPVTEAILSSLRTQSDNAITSTLVVDSQPKYERVIAQGARRGYIYTTKLNTDLVAPNDQALDADYSEEDVDNYNSPLSETTFPGYDTLDLEEKERLNDNERRSKYNFVFSSFTFPFNWNGLAHDDTRVMFPKEDDIKYQAYLWSNLRISNYLPMKSSEDYEAPDSPSPVGQTPTTDFRKPFVVFPHFVNKKSRTLNGTFDPITGLTNPPTFPSPLNNSSPPSSLTPPYEDCSGWTAAIVDVKYQEAQYDFGDGVLVTVKEGDHVMYDPSQSKYIVLSGPDKAQPLPCEEENEENIRTEWVYSHKIGSVLGKTRREDETDKFPDFFSVVRPHTGQPGLDLRVQGKGLSHTQFKRGYTPDEPSDPNYVGVFDISEALATIRIETDEFVQGAYPTPADPATNDFASTLTIRLGDHYYYDTITAGTVIDVVGSQLVTSAAGALRDDRNILNNFAFLHYTLWASRIHTSFQLEVPFLTGNLMPGTYVTQIDEYDSNAVVTDLTYNFVNLSTSVTNQAVQPDVSQFFPVLRRRLPGVENLVPPTLRSPAPGPNPPPIT